MTTNETLDMHRPTPEFRDFLEGEVIRQYRRRRTFRRVRAAAVIIVSAGIGMSATLASAQVRVGAQQDSLKDALAAEAVLATTRFMIAKTQLTDQQKQVAAGIRQAGTLSEAELQLRVAEEEVARIVLNGREIEASGLPPRDELNAPLVKGEDFVKQRIQNRLMTADKKLQISEQYRDVVSRRVAVGAASELELADAELEILRNRAFLAVVAERLKAREEYVAKKTPVSELYSRIERTNQEQTIGVLQRAVTNAQARLAFVEKRQQVGAASEADVLRARLDALERDVDLQLALQRLKRLK
jgi:hypothetical protein